MKSSIFQLHISGTRQTFELEWKVPPIASVLVHTRLIITVEIRFSHPSIIINHFIIFLCEANRFNVLAVRSNTSDAPHTGSASTGTGREYPNDFLSATTRNKLEKDNANIFDDYYILHRHLIPSLIIILRDQSCTHIERNSFF